MMPAGNYFIGDICYIIRDEIEQKNEITISQYKGHKIVTINTHEGNGIFGDQQGNVYCVDSGRIGLIPIELIENNNLNLASLGRFVNFENEFECKTDGKILSFGHIMIKTDKF